MEQWSGACYHHSVSLGWILDAGEAVWNFAVKRRAPTVPAKRILIIEDNHSSAFLLSEILQSMGHRAMVAETAEEAKGLIKRNHIDVVFLDMRLPHIQGWEFLPLIEANSPESKVVITCGEIGDLTNIPQPVPVCVIMAKPYSPTRVKRAMGMVGL